MIEHFRDLLAYETWANARVLDSLETIPPHRRSGPAFERAMQLLGHNQLARRVWLWRLTGTAYENPREWFPTLPVAQQREMCAETDRMWGAYLAGLREEDLAKDCRYTSSEGVAYASTVREVLTHVFNHSTYHRGQIARLVVECEGTRAATDYIVMGRRRLG